MPMTVNCHRPARAPWSIGAARLWALWLLPALHACSTPVGSAPGLAAAAAPAVAQPTPAPAPAPAPAPTPTPGASARSIATPGAPAFDTVIKGATVVPGALPLWTRQDKVWVELRPQDFHRPFFLSPKLVTGIGESGFFGGLLASQRGALGRPQLVEFHQIEQQSTQVQLVAVNHGAWGLPNTPSALAVKQAFSNSLLGSVAVASAPHPVRHSVLVELSSLLGGDVLGLGIQLQRAFRQPYALDARNSGVVMSHNADSGLTLSVQQHYAATTLTAPSPVSAGAPPTPQPRVPVELPDARSLFITVQYTLAPLPAAPMAPRVADARVGYFTTTRLDFSDELARTPRQRWVNRWRLEPQDPTQEKSKPVRPLRFWLDRSIPLAYRDTIRAGILEWNRAFEAAGFLQALEVLDSTSEAPQDIVGNGQVIVRWMTNSQPAFGAIGPSHVDPRSGEILTADIALESLSSRNLRSARSQVLAGARPMAGSDGTASLSAPQPDDCLHGDLAAEQLAYAIDVASLRGVLPPDSDEVKAFVLAYLKDTTMHEVGHILGLRHNFKGSRWHTAGQLADRALTEREGNSASVMDYAAINLGLPGEPAGTPFQTTLGPYDVWAIEYAYKPLRGTTDQQATALRELAARSAQPAWADALNYGSDEDNAQALDPEAVTFDLGRDPVVFARQRLAIAAALVARQEGVVLAPGDDAALLRRRVSYALRDAERASQVLARQIGGVVTRRDAPGSGRDLLDPVPAEQQRLALALLVQHTLSAQALHLSPALQRRLAVDFFERDEGATDSTGQPVRPDFSASGQLLRIQRQSLDFLMSEALSERLLDNADKTRDRSTPPLTVAEVNRHLREAIWPRNGGLAESTPWRRDLQREHANRLSALILRGTSRADVRALARLEARELVTQLQARGPAPTDRTEQAHRQDVRDTLQRALDARVVRASP